MNKQQFIRVLRNCGLISLAELTHFQLIRARNLLDNYAFHRTFHNFAVPPDRFLYDTSGDVNYRLHRSYGLQIAQYYLNLLREHSLRGSDEPFRVLEWGCGPGRIIRHFPELVSDDAFEIYACDYDSDYISWCSANIPGVDFCQNGLSPPLDFPDQFFNGIYSVSVFTHLSESMHYAWISELARVLKPGGILMLTLHGDLYSEKLLPDELVTYQKGALVVRGQVIEGSHFFAAFHPTSFVHKWLSGFDILAHIQNPLPPYILQDQWIVRKKL